MVDDEEHQGAHAERGDATSQEGGKPDSSTEEESDSNKNTGDNKGSVGDPKESSTASIVVPAPRPAIFVWTFHIETIRFVAALGFLVVLGVGYIITNYTSDINHVHPPDETVVYEIFGFNHACNIIDHNPAKTVGAILVPLYQYPMILYVILFHFRLARSVQEEGIVPSWVLACSYIISPFNVLAFSQLHLVFVNSPDEEYGFVAHYIPYLVSFQLTTALTCFLNVQYLIYKDQVPFGVPAWAANAYQMLFMLMVVFYTIMVCTVLTNNPVLDMKNDETHKLIAQVFTAVFAVWILLGPILFSSIERRNGDLSTITFG